jgi:MATE family multidrug resistance protein
MGRRTSNQRAPCQSGFVGVVCVWRLAGMGAVGCAVATFCVQLALVVAAYLLMKHQRDYVLFVPLVGFDCIEKPDPITLKRFLKLGIPGGLAMLFEVTSFTLMAVLIARMGVETAAAHQIAANTAAVMFMLPLSLSVACSARVSYWMGAGDKASSILALKLGLGLVLSCAVLMSGLTAAIAQHIPSAYTKSPVVASTATALVLWVCLYHVGDALQTLCVYALRSFYVTVAPFLVYAVALWGLGLGGGWWLAYGDRAPGSVGLGHPSGFWMAASASVAVTAAIFSWMLWRRARSFAKAQTALA